MICDDFMIIDTHCHVYDGEMENAEETIRQALDNDIHLILNGTDFKSNIEVLKMAEKYLKRIYPYWTGSLKMKMSLP